jgi:small nuclear ribonucleoprotein G
MSKHTGPDLKKYMEKNVSVKMNGNRKVNGTLRGYDQFMNLVLDNATEDGNDTKNIGQIVIRGNSVVQLEIIPWVEDK